MRKSSFFFAAAGAVTLLLAAPVIAQQYGGPQGASNSYDVFEEGVNRNPDDQQGLQEGEPTRQRALIYGEQEGYGWTPPERNTGNQQQFGNQGNWQQRGRFGGSDIGERNDQLGGMDTQRGADQFGGSQNLGSTDQGQYGSQGFDEGSSLETDRMGVS